MVKSQTESPQESRARSWALYFHKNSSVPVPINFTFLRVMNACCSLLWLNYFKDLLKDSYTPVMWIIVLGLSQLHVPLQKVPLKAAKSKTVWWAACTTRHYASAALWAENMRIFKLSSVFQTHWKKTNHLMFTSDTPFFCFLCDMFPTV